MNKNNESEIPVKVSFLDDEETIKIYNEKYYIFNDDVSLENLAVLNIVINTTIDNDDYEIYIQGINIFESDGEGSYTVNWGMSNLQYFDADISSLVEETARKVIKDVIEDILTKFVEDTKDDSI